MPRKSSGYRVMEYLHDNERYIIGWVLIEPSEYTRWKKTPQRRDRHVSGYCIIAGLEQCAEFGSVPCSRLWDYHHTIDALPKKPFDSNALEDRFQPAS